MLAAEVGLIECGLPNTPRLEQSHVLTQLRVRVQTAAGVVEVHMAAAVKPRELGLAKLVETGGVGVLGVLADERGLCVLKRLSSVASDAHVDVLAVSVMRTARLRSLGATSADERVECDPLSVGCVYRALHALGTLD